MNEGDLCLLKPNAYHCIFSDQIESETMIFNILVRRAVLDSIYFKLLSYNEFISTLFLESEDVQVKKDHIIFTRQSSNYNYEEIVQLLIFEFLQNELYTDTMVKSLFSAMLIKLAREYKSKMQNQKDTANRKPDISEILQYMVDHYDDISLNMLANQFNYHQVYLSNLIHKEIGKNFTEILKEVRLERAADLLRETSLPVSEILFAVGYTNRTWFTQQFEKRYGILPSAYRKKYQKASPF